MSESESEDESIESDWNEKMLTEETAHGLSANCNLLYFNKNPAFYKE